MTELFLARESESWQRVFFESASGFKLIRENPYFTQADSYTLDVSIPMDILDNRRFFQNLQRMETSKAPAVMQCRLLVDNIPVIYGSARVTQVSGQSVKVQLIGGNSEINFLSGDNNDFIDQLPLGSVTTDNTRTGVDKYITTTGIRLALSPANNETSGGWSNHFHFSLVDIMEKMLEHYGYTVTSDSANIEPWNKVFVATALQTTEVAHTLPHWKPRTFIEEFSKKIDEYNKRREPAQGNMLDEVVVTYNPRKSGGYSPTGGNSGGGKGGSGSKTDPYDVDLKELEAAYKNRQLLTKKHLADGLLTERQFQDESYNTEMEHLTAKLELQKKYGKETADTEIQMLDLTMQQVKDARQRSAQVLQEELKTAEESYNSDLLELARQRAEGVIGTDREYQERVKETERDYLQQRLAIVRKYGGDTIQEEKAVLDKQVQDVEEFRKQMAKAYEKAYSQADTLDDQRTFAQMMYDQQLIDFEEYQQRMTEIEEVETQKRKDVRQQFFEISSCLFRASFLLLKLR
jgi:hypothetical protein